MKILKQHAAVKSIGGIVLLLLVFFAVVSIIGYNSFTEALMSQYSEGAFLTAETAAQMVDADRMDEYVESEGATQEYLDVWNQLDHLCNSSGSTFVYVIRPDRSDYAHITFLFSTIDHKELVIRDRGYIETDAHITAMIGLKGSDGQVKAILCVQRQMDVLSVARQKYINKIILTLIILVVLVVVGQSLFLHRTLLQPLKQISDEALRFSKEGEKTEKKLRDTIRNQDEIGHLAGSIDRMEEEMGEKMTVIATASPVPMTTDITRRT